MDRKSATVCAIAASLALIGIGAATGQSSGNESQRVSPFEPTWNSLSRHANPGWLKDAKFGIYTHWGPAPGQSIDDFKAEKFDAGEWAELFRNAGAQFAGIVSEHGGTRVVMWNSKVTDMNAVKRGPHRDIVGELKPAITRRGMKFLVSLHSFGGGDRRLRRGGKAWEVVDQYQPDLVWFDLGLGGSLGAKYQDIYIGGKNVANQQENKIGAAEVESDRREFLAHYFNSAREWGKEVQVVYKEHDFPPGVAMRDLENGRAKDLAYDEWMSDMNIQIMQVGETKVHDPWLYEEGVQFHSTRALIHELVDATSKNGRLLLSVGPKPDGTFPEVVTDHLMGIGKWLGINGEAIYGTTPWILYGEGPTELKGIDLGLYSQDHHYKFYEILNMVKRGEMQFDHYTLFREIDYTPQDIRFTTKESTLYAICLGWPGTELTIHSLGTRAAMREGEIKSISMLGSDERLEYEHKPEGLVIKMPHQKPGDFAYVLKIVR